MDVGERGVKLDPQLRIEALERRLNRAILESVTWETAAHEYAGQVQELQAKVTELERDDALGEEDGS